MLCKPSTKGGGWTKENIKLDDIFKKKRGEGKEKGGKVMKKLFMMPLILVMLFMLCPELKAEGKTTPPDGILYTYDSGDQVDAYNHNNNHKAYYYLTGHTWTVIIDGSQADYNTIWQMPATVNGKKISVIYFINYNSTIYIDDNLGDHFDELVFFSVSAIHNNSAYLSNAIYFKHLQIPALDLTGITVNSLNSSFLNGEVLTDNFIECLNDMNNAPYIIAYPDAIGNTITNNTKGNENYNFVTKNKLQKTKVYVHQEKINKLHDFIKNSKYNDETGYIECTGNSHTPLMGFANDIGVDFPGMDGKTFDIQYRGNGTEQKQRTAGQVYTEFLQPLPSDVTGVSPLTYKYGQTVTLSQPSRPYYDFVAWHQINPVSPYGYISEFGKNPVITAGTYINNFIFAAEWKKHEYSITYDLGYTPSSGSKTETKKYTVDNLTKDTNDDYDKKMRITESRSRTGYEFLGWKDKNGNIVTETELMDNLKLTAAWKPISYSIEYVYMTRETENGGVRNLQGTVSIDTGKMKAFYTAEDEVTLPTPSCAGYDFTGWYDGNTKVTKIEKGTTGNKKLTARWTVQKFNLVCKNGNEIISSQKFTVEDSFTVSFYPSMDGYEFVGWDESPSGDGSKIYMVNHQARDITLYAKWSAISYKLTLVLNGGSMGSFTRTSFTVMDSFTIPDPTRDGYTFIGWSNHPENASFLSKSYEIKNRTGDITLYANWSVKPKAATTETERKPDRSTTETPIQPEITTTEAAEKADSTMNETAVTPEEVTTKPAPKSDTTTMEEVEKPAESPEQPAAVKRKETAIKAKSYEKEYGCKAFPLKAKCNSDGKLAYKSSNRKVAVVSAKGQVTVKGIGETKITIRVPQTADYEAAKKTVAIKVFPGKVKSFRIAKREERNKRRMLFVKWKKLSGVTGYEIRWSAKSLGSKKYKGKKLPASQQTYDIVDYEEVKKLNADYYYVKIRAYKKNGKKVYYGKWKTLKIQ